MSKETDEYKKGYMKGFEMGFKCSCNLFNKVVATNMKDLIEIYKKIKK